MEDSLQTDTPSMETSELDVMKDFVDEESCSSANLDESEASDDTEGRPRRKKFVMASHIIIIEDSSPTCYCCTVCKSYFSHKRTARNHEFCGSEKPFKCKLCDKRFVKKSDRENHHKTHTGERPFVCSICDKSFYIKHKLNRHVRSHTGVKGDFQCSSCSRSFISREALRKHQVNKHNPKRSIKCDNCGKCFEKTEERQKHKCTRPPKKRKLVCEVCGKTFSKNWNLTVHLRIHIGQRPYKCPICKKSFRLQQHLERHSTKHQADADFECMLCKQTFGRKDNMIRHLKLNHPDRHLGVDIKDMVQQSENAKMAKSKKLLEERVLEASAENSLTVLPLDNLPNIRFAKRTSDASAVDPCEDKINPSTSVPSVSGSGTQKLLETRTERKVVVQTVSKPGASSVLRRVDTLRFVQTTVVERVDPFASRKPRRPTPERDKPQPSVLVFNTPQANEASNCAVATSGSLDQQGQVEEGNRPQRVSVLQFSSKHPKLPCQR